MYLSELDAYLLLYNVDKPLKVLYLISALLVKKRSSRTSIFNKVFIIFSIGKSGQIAGADSIL
jgi:hypothetical protein